MKLFFKKSKKQYVSEIFLYRILAHLHSTYQAAGKYNKHSSPLKKIPIKATSLHSSTSNFSCILPDYGPDPFPKLTQQQHKFSISCRKNVQKLFFFAFHLIYYKLGTTMCEDDERTKQFWNPPAGFIFLKNRGIESVEKKLGQNFCLNCCSSIVGP